MGKDKRNENHLVDDNSSNFLNDNLFSRCDSSTQSELIKAELESQKMKTGKLGLFFGTDDKASSKNIAFVVCAALVLVLIADFIVEVCVYKKEMNNKLCDIIIPVITLFLGYLFA